MDDNQGNASVFPSSIGSEWKVLHDCLLLTRSLNSKFIIIFLLLHQLLVICCDIENLVLAVKCT